MAINQLNLPAIHGAAERVKGQRLQNKLYSQQLAQVGKLSREDQFANLKELRLAADWAKTPEQWGQTVGFLNRVTNSDEFSKYRFEDRDVLIAGMDKEIAKWGRPLAAVSPGGDPTLIQTTPKGDVRELPGGYTPPGKTGGDLTIAQRRTNAQVDQARASLKEQGMTQEEIIRIAKSQKDTGRANPDYNPFINRMVGLATQRKYGTDPEFSQTYQTYLMPAPEPAPVAPPPPPPAGPGWIDRGIDWMGDLFSGDDAPAGKDAPYEADLNGRAIYSNDGQVWFYDDGTPVQ